MEKQWLKCAGYDKRRPASQWESMGKDLTLVDPISKMPVGLLPDFLDLDMTDEKYVERISGLYRGSVVQVTPEGSVCRHLPLDSVQLHVPDP
jgi:hypothetical protein